MEPKWTLGLVLATCPVLDFSSEPRLAALIHAHNPAEVSGFHPAPTAACGTVHTRVAGSGSVFACAIENGTIKIKPIKF